MSFERAALKRSVRTVFAPAGTAGFFPSVLRDYAQVFLDLTILVEMPGGKYSEERLALVMMELENAVTEEELWR